MEKIVKSCTAGISDTDFERFHCSGLTTFISYARLMSETIGQNLHKNEHIRGMIMDKDGITLYLEIIK
jgi:hypothetical protein